MLCMFELHPFSLGDFTYHWELNENQGFLLQNGHGQGQSLYRLTHCVGDNVVNHNTVQRHLYDTLDITTHFCKTKLFSPKLPVYTTTTLDNAPFRIFVLSYQRGSQCYNSFYPCSVRLNYIHFHLGTSLIIGNLMKFKVPSVEWTWLGLEWPPAQYVALYTGDIVSPIS